MQKLNKSLKTTFILLLVIILAGSGCAVKKNPYSSGKKKSASIANATQLGRNKYYFSVGYQKKLQKSVRRK